MEMAHPPLDLDAVQAFVHVAELDSFTRAAEAMRTTQSAVSLKLKRLERRLGCRLIERTPRHVQLSAQGAVFLDHARHLLALQLREPAFEVSLLCGGLMSAPPSRPSNDEGWLNAPLRQSDRYAPDFLDRPRNRQAWR